MATPKETITLGQLEIRFFEDSDSTAGRLSLFEFVVPSGARVPAPHYHADVDEMLYQLEGTLNFTVAGQLHELSPGDSCFVPRGVVHGFVNAASETSRTLAMLTPGLFGPAYFREMAALLAAGGPPDPARVGDVMGRHGLVVAGDTV